MEVFELVPFSVSKIELSIKYPKLGVVAPSFGKTGDEIKSQDENITQEKRGDQTSFTPSLRFALPLSSLLLLFFIKSSLVKIESCKSCELIPSFIKRCPVFNTL
jgi:hypothetical protein